MTGCPHVVIIGGGITGLAAAWELVAGTRRESHQSGTRPTGPGSSGAATEPPRVTILESTDHPGGKLAAAEVSGILVDTGPDAFLARGIAAVSLCESLGIELVSPRVSSAYVWARGKLRPLPAGLMLGFPTRLLPVMRSGIVSPAGLARAGLDLVLPSRHLLEDFSVANAVTPRLGREVNERLVEPMLGGIHASTAATLSLPEVAPAVAGALRSHRSAIGALRALPKPPPAADRAPVFLAPRGGAHRLADALAGELRSRNVTFRTQAAVANLSPAGEGVTIEMDNGEYIGTDAVVVAIPAPQAARLLGGMDPDLADELAAIRYASVAVVTLAYPAGSIPDTLAGTGFLVPRCESRLMTAATWLSHKWEHYAAARAPEDSALGSAMHRGGVPGGVDLVRVSVGRIDDERHAALDDGELIERVHAELREAMTTVGVALGMAPAHSAVTRWPAALPQYEVGHRARINRVEARAAAFAHIFLAGAYLHGVGVPACVESGIAAARAALRSTAGRQ